MLNKEKIHTMSNRWKDITGKSYGNYEVVESEIKLGIFRLAIHHYILYGDKWFASCPHIFKQEPLYGQDITSLKQQAIEKFKVALNDALNDIPVGE